MGRRVEIWTGHSSAAGCRSSALLSQDLDGGSNVFQNPPNWSTLGRTQIPVNNVIVFANLSQISPPPQSGRPSYCPREIFLMPLPISSSQSTVIPPVTVTLAPVTHTPDGQNAAWTHAPVPTAPWGRPSTSGVRSDLAVRRCRRRY